MQVQSLNDLRDEVHAEAVKKGWWPEKFQRMKREPAIIHMLIVTEIAEATEEARKNMPPVYTVDDFGVIKTIDPFTMFPGDFTQDEQILKPEGELIELADAVIRILDYCGAMGWNIEQAIQCKLKFNATREMRHGGKKF